VARLAGVPHPRILRRNESAAAELREVKAQPDFDEAVNALGWLSTEDRKLIAHTGKFFVSPALEHIYAGREETFA
jgi:hypothetical protein